ncbi:hypothetical protein HUB92_01610 [Wolbachia endosymbiont of Wiebesia pumilae]|uniref:hypothetical protein n=1 Tax=Wolbachia endosymbiont of Wiebesia pumilae TaxID=2742717 RepID=UPI001AE33616|nr:hypothetical protein [Wolbachia endosymbiont of Wiebesia pumilae]QTP61655.1 hypothetical protein HUB92_01610 [Wolbachia endosymbiont of Wiebesia pumilae]
MLFTRYKLNASDNLFSKLCCDIDAAGKEKDTRSVMHQRKVVVAVSAGVVLLVSSVALYIMKMPVVVAVVGIAGLSCIGFALYNLLKPNAKLEKVEDIEQLIVESPKILKNEIR